jgi:tight adherence protein C
MSLLIFATAAIAVSVAALVVYVGNGVVRARENSSRRLIRLQSRTEVLETGFAERALAPVVERVGRFALRFTPQGWSSRIQRKLRVAGWSHRFDPNSWAAVRIVSIVGALLIWFLIQGAIPGAQKVLTFALFAFAGFAGPDAILARRIEERSTAMERQLPDIIDLLVISVEAGLGFDAALGRVVQTVPGELSDEFARVLQETRVGMSRHDAMKALAERTDVDDLNSFILSMNQADTFGVSIARMLRVQADEIRVRRRQRAQERAFAAPVKMVFPLVLCIFPSLFVVLLGPAVIEIVRSFAD